MLNLHKTNAKHHNNIMTTLFLVTILLGGTIIAPLLPSYTVLAIDTLHPGQVAGISNVTKVAAGFIHSLFLKSDGTVWTAGDNSSGQLGDNTTTGRCTVVQVVINTGGTPLTNVVEIAAGFLHSLARKSDGTVWAWGDNTYGQIGDTTTGTDRLFAVQVSGVSSAIGIAAGGDHNLALISGGTVKSWGRNDFGQLGDNTTTNRSTAVTVNTGALSDATQVSAGRFHSLALRGNNSGKLKAWGKGDEGQLGSNAFSNILLPSTMADSTGATFTDASYVSGGINFTVVTTTGGKVWATGQGGNGQLGSGCSIFSSGLVKIPSYSGVSKAVTGSLSEHDIALKTNATLNGWGRNDFGQVGDGSTTNRCSPVSVLDSFGSPVSGFTDISANGLNSLAVKSDGTAWSWGDNLFCQLGR
ncbi:MAG: hypothetical protein WBV94_15550 [Blastocatellia bacterium]